MFASTMTVNDFTDGKPIYQNEPSRLEILELAGINMNAYVSASLNGVTGNSTKAADNHIAFFLLPYVYSTIATRLIS